MADKNVKQYPPITQYYNPKDHLIWDPDLDTTKTILKYVKDSAKRVAYITLNRPEKLNYTSHADCHELIRLMDRIEPDDDIKSVVIRGAGPVFSTGAFMGTVGFAHGIQTGGQERRAPQRTRLATDKFAFAPGGYIDRWQYLNKLTIAQVRGYCLGLAFWIALHSDFVIASEDAVFGHPAYRWVGASVDGCLAQVIATIGPKRARKFTMLGVALSAKEALEAGLVTEVVPPDKLEQRVAEYVEACALQPIDGIATSKAAFEVAEAALGQKVGRLMGYLMHTVNSNLRYEPDEWSFFRDRRERGLKDSMAEREKRWESIPGFGFPWRAHPYQTTREHQASKAYLTFSAKPNPAPRKKK